MTYLTRDELPPEQRARFEQFEARLKQGLTDEQRRIHGSLSKKTGLPLSIERDGQAVRIDQSESIPDPRPPSGRTAERKYFRVQLQDGTSLTIYREETRGGGWYADE